MQEFVNDEQGYTSWLESHPHGYVLAVNALGKDHHRIHRASCLHLYDPDPNVRRTRKIKVVANDQGSLLSCP